MSTETMDEFMMIINDCYPVSAYKKHYLTARCVLNEAKKLEPANDDDVEKAMWICALLDDLKQVPVGRFEHTFEYKDISFDSAEFIREAFPQKELLDSMMSISNYAMAFDEMHYMVPDADGFGLFAHIRDIDVEKCKWIAAIYEVLTEAVEKYAQPIFAERNIRYDWEDFFFTHIATETKPKKTKKARKQRKPNN